MAITLLDFYFPVERLSINGSMSKNEYLIPTLISLMANGDVRHTYNSISYP